MKKSIFYILSILLMASTVNAQTEKKEVVLVGTMHWVPNIIKKAYKPMFKRASDYSPENIYVEYIPKADTESMEFYNSKFSYEVDSIRKLKSINLDSVQLIQKKDLHDLTSFDIKYLKKYYLLEKDLLHYKYYQYLDKHGFQGSAKPTQNESGDVSFKLAARMGHKELIPIDYQVSNKDYYKYWTACDSTYVAQGKDKEISKLMKRINRKIIIGTLLRGNAQITNQKKVYESFHKVNSLQYFEKPEAVCKEGAKAWEVRNDRMIDYIGNGILTRDVQRNLVVVGAGHLYSLKKGLEERYPNLVVKTLYK